MAHIRTGRSGEEEASPPPVQSATTRLRGLPYSATEEDLIGFFEDFDIKSTHICKRSGRASGEAYVQFASEAEAERALKTKNRQHMGQRYIEIFTADDTDVTAMKGLSSDSKLKGWILRLRGLPFNATDEDVVQFFEGLEVLDGTAGVHMPKTPEGRPLGEAYVEFASEAEQQEALQRNRNKLGSRYIELFVSSKAEMHQGPPPRRRRQLQDNGYAGMGGGRGRGMGGRMPPPQYVGGSITGGVGLGPGSGRGAPDGAPEGTTLRLRGLPYSATEVDIVEFFKGYSLAPDGVRLQMRQERGGGGGMQGTGLAYVTFVSAEEAERARQERDRQVIGTRYIECMPYTPQPPSYGAPGGGGGYGEGGGAGGGRGPHPSGEAMGGGEPAGVPPPPGAPGGSPSGGPLGGPGQGAHMGGGHMVGPPGGGHMGGGHMGGGHMGGPHTGGFGSGERGFGLAPGAHMGPPAIPGRAPPGGGPNREGGVPAGGLGMAQPPPPHRTGGLAPAPPNPPPYDARHPGPSIPGAKGPVKVNGRGSGPKPGQMAAPHALGAGPVPHGGHLVGAAQPGDYGAAHQHQLMMQQQQQQYYLHQQHMMQQQHALRGYGHEWGGSLGGGMGGHPQGSAGGSGKPGWFPGGYGNPGLGGNQGMGGGSAAPFGSTGSAGMQAGGGYGYGLPNLAPSSVVGGTRDRSGGGAAPNLAPGPPASSLSSAPAPGSTLPAAADVSAAVAAAAVPGGARGASPQVPGSSAPAAGSGASAGASAGSPGSGMLSNGGLPAGTQADPV